jgi:hypothetical protein
LSGDHTIPVVLKDDFEAAQNMASNVRSNWRIHAKKTSTQTICTA